VVIFAAIAALLLPAGVAFGNELDDLIHALSNGKPTFNL
jgi:hypothetical protein